MLVKLTVSSKQMTWLVMKLSAGWMELQTRQTEILTFHTTIFKQVHLKGGVSKRGWILNQSEAKIIFFFPIQPNKSPLCFVVGQSFFLIN